MTLLARKWDRFPAYSAQMPLGVFDVIPRVQPAPVVHQNDRTRGTIPCRQVKRRRVRHALAGRGALEQHVELAQGTGRGGRQRLDQIAAMSHHAGVFGGTTRRRRLPPPSTP